MLNNSFSKILVKENPDKGAAKLIADMLIARQEEKLKTKALLNNKEDISGEEKW